MPAPPVSGAAWPSPLSADRLSALSRAGTSRSCCRVTRVGRSALGGAGRPWRRKGADDRGCWRRTWPFGGQTLPGSGTLPVWSVQLFPLLLARPFPCTRPSQADQPDPAHPNCPEANVKPAAGPNDRKDAPLALITRQPSRYQAAQPCQRPGAGLTLLLCRRNRQRQVHRKGRKPKSPPSTGCKSDVQTGATGKPSVGSDTGGQARSPSGAVRPPRSGR